MNLLNLKKVSLISIACSISLMSSTIFACLPEVPPAVTETRSNNPNFEGISLPTEAGSDLARKQLVVFLNITANSARDSQSKGQCCSAIFESGCSFSNGHGYGGQYNRKPSVSSYFRLKANH